MNDYRCNLSIHGFPIENKNINIYSNRNSKRGLPKSTLENNSRILAAENFCLTLKSLLCQNIYNLDFLLKQISLLSKHQLDYGTSILGHLNAVDPIFVEFLIKSDDLTPELINDLLNAYRNFTLLLQGPQGEKGEPGDVSFNDLTEEQKDSLKGKSNYIHFAFSSSPDGLENFSNVIFDEAVYMGVCTTNSDVAPSTYDSYQWIKVKGDKGDPFKFEDFTEELLEQLKPTFKYDDLTPELQAELAGNMITYGISYDPDDNQLIFGNPNNITIPEIELISSIDKSTTSNGRLKLTIIGSEDLDEYDEFKWTIWFDDEELELITSTKTLILNSESTQKYNVARFVRIKIELDNYISRNFAIKN